MVFITISFKTKLSSNSLRKISHANTDIHTHTYVCIHIYTHAHIHIYGQGAATPQTPPEYPATSLKLNKSEVAREIKYII